MPFSTPASPATPKSEPSAFELAERIAAVESRQAAPFEADVVHTTRGGRMPGDDSEGGDISVNMANSANHGQATEAHSLLDANQSAYGDVVSDQNVFGDRAPVGQNQAVADAATGPDGATGHDEIVIAQHGRAARRWTGGYADKLPDLVAISYDQTAPRRGTRLLLAMGAEACARGDEVVGSRGNPAAYENMRSDLRAAADDGIAGDVGVGADGNSGAQHRILMDRSGWMDHGIVSFRVHRGAMIHGGERVCKPHGGRAPGGDETGSKNAFQGACSPVRWASRRMKPSAQATNWNAGECAAGVRAGNAGVLARAITLVESTAAGHAAVAADLMKMLLPHGDNSVRIGVTGVPGVGKSTFIEAFGLYLCEQGHRVAVLAVDPTSVVSGGSILGDKTRMERLSRHPSAYIRPSPSGGALGGVTRKTRETITLCEAAGYDVILVETVGVGQSEIVVRSMTDFFLLLALTGAGDELQGIKKGIVEMADAIAVTKADGDNLAAAESLKIELSQILHVLTPVTVGWKPEVLTCSAIKGSGIAGIWKLVERFCSEMKSSGEWEARRLCQVHEGLMEFAREQVLVGMEESNVVMNDLGRLGADVAGGRMALREAAAKIAADFLRERGKG